MSEAPVLFLGDDFSKQWLPNPWGDIPESWDWQEVYLAMKMNDTFEKDRERDSGRKGREGRGEVFSLIFNRENQASFFFFSHRVACGILIPQPGIESHPQQWKHGVLTAEPPRKPQAFFF